MTGDRTGDGAHASAMRLNEEDPVLARSREAIRDGSKSFAGAAALFNREMRESAYMLYAWCRHCDDVIDGQHLGQPVGHHPGQPQTGAGSPSGPDEQLEELIALTRSAYRGDTVEEPVFKAFQRVVERHTIPEAYPLDLLYGFRMDVAGERYRTLSDTLTYGYHVAGTVGVMMAIVMGVSDERALDRACDLGIAFQLTNIARDVVDDARLGRVYLPETWLEEEGFSAAALLDPNHRGALAATVRRLLGEADAYYASAWYGLAALPFRAAWAIATARRVYRRIGKEVAKRGAKAWDERVSIGRAKKLGLAAAALGDVIATRFVRTGAAPDRADLWTREAAPAKA